MSAPQLYAASQGTRCEGKYECHWCGSPCDDLHRHDDPPPVPFVKYKSTAKRPNANWVCRGCALFRRKRVTVPYMSGGYSDGKSAADYSWWVTPQGAYAVLQEHHAALYDHLLAPPLHFCLALRQKEKVLLHLAAVNELSEIKATTPLAFTLDNKAMEYTVYELEEALRQGTQGRIPGARALVEALGPFDLAAKRERGRPRKEEEPLERSRRVVAKKD